MTPIHLTLAAVAALAVAGQVRRRGRGSPNMVTDEDGDPVVVYHGTRSTDPDLGLRGRRGDDPPGPASWLATGRPVSNPKTWATLQQDLRELGLGVLGVHFMTGSLKSCSSTAPEVGAYLHERGHVVGSGGNPRGYSGHFTVSVKTSDRGWFVVDPTYMQFHCRYDVENDEYDDGARILAPLLAHFERILQDGVNAFEILPLAPGDVPRRFIYSPPPVYYSHPTWGSYFAGKERYAKRALLAAEGKAKMRSIPWYAELMAERKRTGSRHSIEPTSPSVNK